MNDTGSTLLPPEFIALKKEFTEALPDRIGVIETMWHRLVELSAPDDAIDQLIKEVHKLVGIAGLYGFPSITQNSRELETEINLYKESRQQQTVFRPERIQSLIDQLKLPF